MIRKGFALRCLAKDLHGLRGGAKEMRGRSVQWKGEEPAALQRKSKEERGRGAARMGGAVEWQGRAPSRKARAKKNEVWRRNCIERMCNGKATSGAAKERP